MPHLVLCGEGCDEPLLLVTLIITEGGCLSHHCNHLTHPFNLCCKLRDGERNVNRLDNNKYYYKGSYTERQEIFSNATGGRVGCDTTLACS